MVAPGEFTRRAATSLLWSGFQGFPQDATSRQATCRMAGMDVEPFDLLLAQGRSDDPLAVVGRPEPMSPWSGSVPSDPDFDQE